MASFLTMSQALSEGRLHDFVAQVEAEEVGPADRAQFEVIIGRITAPLPEDQTSHSLAAGGSRGR